MAGKSGRRPQGREPVLKRYVHTGLMGYVDGADEQVHRVMVVRKGKARFVWQTSKGVEVPKDQTVVR